MSVFNRLASSARKALTVSRKECIRLQQIFVNTEHLLVGILQQDSSGGVVGRILKSIGVDKSELRRMLECEMERTADSPCVLVQLPFTHRAKRVLELSCSEAMRFGAPEVQLEHLLLGLLREDESTAAKVLQSAGVDLATARVELQRLTGIQAVQEPSVAGPSALPLCKPAGTVAVKTGPCAATLVDESNAVMARIGCGDNGLPYLALYDVCEHERVTVHVREDGAPVLELRDGSGSVIFTWP